MLNKRKSTGLRMDVALIKKLKLKSAWLEITFEDLCNRVLWREVEDFNLEVNEDKNKNIETIKEI